MSIIKDFIIALYESLFKKPELNRLGGGYIQAPVQTILNDFAPDWALEWEEAPISEQLRSEPSHS